MRQKTVSRRAFVAGTAGVAFGAMVVPRHVLGGAGYLAPSERVNVAVVGCGGQGAADASEIVTGGHNLVALADVDFGYVDSAMAGRARDRNGQPNPSGVKLQEAYGKAKRYADFHRVRTGGHRAVESPRGAGLARSSDGSSVTISGLSGELGKNHFTGQGNGSLAGNHFEGGSIVLINSSGSITLDFGSAILKHAGKNDRPEDSLCDEPLSPCSYSPSSS